MVREGNLSLYGAMYRTSPPSPSERISYANARRRALQENKRLTPPPRTPIPITEQRLDEMRQKPHFDLSQHSGSYQNPITNVPSEEYYGKTYPDWSRRLNILVRAAQDYRESVKTLAAEPSDLIRAVEGLNPEYGQYENVKNSGWTETPMVSLRAQNGLSVRDKIAYGLPVPGDMPDPFDALKNEKAAKKLGEKLSKQGKENPDLKYQKKFSQLLLENLKEFADLEQLEGRNDDISRLAKIRLQAIFKRLEMIQDEDKLSEYSGVDQNFSKLKDKFIYQNLLPDLQEKEGAAGASWWGVSDERIKQEMYKRVTPKFRYVHPILQLSATERMTDPADHGQVRKMNNAYEGLSDTAKSVLTSYQDQLKRISSNEKSLQSDFILNNFVKNHDLFGDEETQKKHRRGVKGMPGVTNLHGRFPESLNNHQPIGKSLIDATADTGVNLKFDDFMKKITPGIGAGGGQSGVIDFFANGAGNKTPDFSADFKKFGL